MAIMFGVLGLFLWTIFPTASFENHRGELQIAESEMYYSTEERGNYVSIIGKISNVGDIRWEDPRFEVRFFDSTGKLIDTISSTDYGLVFYPGEESTFRVRAPADKPEHSYHRYDVLIRKAREMTLF